MFGPDRTRGNHGEDVKEYYYHLDATPTHSYCASSTSTRSWSSPTAALVEEKLNAGA